MKFLHTADWHIGKTLKGHDRLEEQTAVMYEVVAIAVANDVDAVLVAGDIYDSAAPTPKAQRLVVRTLHELAKRDIEVVAIAGNHDNGQSLEAFRPVMDVAGIHVYGQARLADAGGVHRFTTRAGEKVNIGVLPFLSQRYAVRAAEVATNTPAQNVGKYEEQLRAVVDNLATGFGDGEINLLMAHLTCTGGAFGGGEREAQSIFEYHVPAGIFPVETHYVALGHLHRRQHIAAGAPVHYSGSPIAVDFGEQENTNVVVLVEAAPGTPARTTDIPITTCRRLRTVEGTVAQLTADPDQYGDDFLRLVVTEPARAGLREQIFEALPNALEIRIHPDHATTGIRAGKSSTVATRSPHELFADYCGYAGVEDERVRALFRQLHDEHTTAHPA